MPANIFSISVITIVIGKIRNHEILKLQLPMLMSLLRAELSVKIAWQKLFCVKQIALSQGKNSI